MDQAARRIACLLWSALAVAALSVSACSSPASCGSPLLPATVTVPLPDLTAIVSVFTDPPCIASNDDSGHVMVTSQLPGTCQVLARLTNGDIYTFSVEFRRASGGSCPDVIGPVDASVPALYDAGAGGD